MFGYPVTCPLPTFHAVSAMGTKLRFYQQVAGQRVIPSGSGLQTSNHNAPECWDCDVLELDGGQRFQAIAEEIEYLITLADDES
jgi:hypothetical protein